MRLALLVLLVAAAVNADKLFPGPPRGRQQNAALNQALNGYLPPRPAPCPTITRNVPTTSIFYTTLTRDVVSTIVQTSGATVVRTQVVPTTVTQRTTVSEGRTRVETVVSTRTTEVVRTSIRTVSEGGSTATVQVTVTSTNIIRSTAFDTRYSTVNRDVEVTRTATTTALQPTTITRRETSEQTRTVPFRPPPVVRVATQTIPVQSTVVREGPGRTIASTVVVQTTVTSAIRSQPPPVFVTRTASTVKTEFVTQTTTVESGSVTTRQVINTRISTVARERTVTRDQLVTSTVTQVIPSTTLRFETSTQVVPSTVFNTRVVTRTVDVPDVRTSTFIENVTRTVTGRDEVVTRSVVSTSIVQRETTISSGRGTTITATKTQTAECGRTTYRYDEPEIKFSFPN